MALNVACVIHVHISVTYIPAYIQFPKCYAYKQVPPNEVKIATVESNVLCQNVE